MLSERAHDSHSFCTGAYHHRSRWATIVVLAAVCLAVYVLYPALLIGLNDSENKGVLLFGMSGTCFHGQRFHSTCNPKPHILSAHLGARSPRYMLTMRVIQVAIPRRCARLIICSSAVPLTLKQSTINSLTLATFSIGNIIGSDKCWAHTHRIFVLTVLLRIHRSSNQRTPQPISQEKLP